MIPGALITLFAGSNPWVVLIAMVAGMGIVTAVKNVPALRATAASEAGLTQTNLLARIEKLEARLDTQAGQLDACEARDAVNKAEISRVTFCTRWLAEELPNDNAVRMKVERMLGVDWTIPPTNTMLAGLAREIDERNGG